MKFFLTTVLLLKLISTCGQAIDKSIIRNDNDYFPGVCNLSSTLVANPKSVKFVMIEILKKYEYNKKFDKATSYKIIIDSNISMYVLVATCNFQKLAFFIPYDETYQKVSSSPVQIDIKWAFENEEGFLEKLLDYPLASIDANNKLLFLKERVHNGNVYNAVITKVYRLNTDLSLTLKFCFESKALLNNGSEIWRRLTSDGFRCYEHSSDSMQYLGKVFADFELGKITLKDCSTNFDCNYLFTISGFPDEELLRKGYVSPY